MSAPTLPAAGDADADAGVHANTAADSAARTGSAFCRIAIAGPRSRADLAVPLGVPLSRLMPALVRHAGEETGPDGGALHEGWALRTADGARLDGARTLGAQQVREGDILFLRHGIEDFGPPLYDDVVEVIGDGSAERAWPTAAVRRTSALFAGVAVVAAAAALAAAPGVLAGFLGLAAALLGIGLGALLSRAFADSVAATCAVVLAALLAAVGAVRLLGGGTTQAARGLDAFGGTGAAQLLLACAVVAAVGAAGPVVVGSGDGPFATLVAGGVLAAVGAFTVTVWDTSPARAASVCAPLALAVTTLWPALALRLAHIPGPQLASATEELERLPGLIGHGPLRVRVDRARELLTGLLAGSNAVLLGGILVLLGTGGLWAGVLAGVLGVLAPLRARLFRETPQVAVALATGVAALLGAAVLLVLDFAGRPLPLLGVVLPLALTIALVACAVGLFSGRRTLNPRLSRLLDTVETLLLLTVVPLILAVWDVYAALLELKA
ncbi:type VII secretion integral membrane protein EccD [Streptomyces smyrnaeus]|uniref:type VII secretion integral membrane protein EccD n=1 Tax=Streptomyces smyrnaeus TaxID=1387713 RepID=UPI0033DC3537